jgi:uncharacterized protein YkwD
MTNWFSKHFIPHEENNHQPHFLRSENIQTVIAILLISQAIFFIFTYFVIPNSKQVAAIIVSSLIDQTNEERVKIKLNNLEVSKKLEESAQLKAYDMASSGYFAHNSPDGKDPWYFFKKSNYSYQYAGENLAVNFIESKDVTNAWMNSKTHRDNLLNSKYTEVGIATALGKYKGRDAIFIVQHFGRPINSIIPTQSITTEKLPENITKIQSEKNDVLGASTMVNPNILSRIIANSSKFNFSIEFATLFLSILALLIAIFVKIRIQHPIIIANGLVIVSITILLLFINSIITQGII